MTRFYNPVNNRVHLQVERGRLDCFLLFPCQASEAGGECVGDDEVHGALKFQLFCRLSSPVVAGHDPMHELIEQWDSERGVAMIRTPDHPFAY